MRLYFTLTPNTEIVPFDYQHFLIGTFHKWLGENELHDRVSLYSMSWFDPGESSKDGLSFPKGTKWFISFFEVATLKKVMSNALKDPGVCFGMKVKDIYIVENPRFAKHQRFVVATPVLIRKFDGKGLKHLTFLDSESESLLTQTMQTKLKAAGMNYERVKVQFDRTYTKAKTKLVTIKGIQNKANYCPVIVEGSPEIVSFAWDVGVGHSTGSGFGALC